MRNTTLCSPFTGRIFPCCAFDSVKHWANISGIALSSGQSYLGKLSRCLNRGNQTLIVSPLEGLMANHAAPTKSPLSFKTMTLNIKEQNVFRENPDLNPIEKPLSDLKSPSR